MDNPGYSRPLPELLDGDDWEVRNSGDIRKAYVDPKKKEFVVPFAPGPGGELVRAHEAMHVKITPAKFATKGVDFVTLQSVEDTRVHQGLRLSGIATDKGRVFTTAELSIFERDPTRNTPLRLGEAVFATNGLAEEEDLRRIVKRAHPRGEEILQICDKLHKKYFDGKEADGVLSKFSDTQDCAKELKKKLDEISTPEEMLKNKRMQEHPGDALDKNITTSWQPGVTDKESGFRDIELPTITEEEMREIKNALPMHSRGARGYGAAPGEMLIQKPRFDSFLKFKKIKNIKKTASDEGIVPSRMYRYASDMRVFSRGGRRRSSTAVLVDVSGSMGLTSKDIVEILRNSPEGIIAIYSGRGSIGDLRIIAEKGRFSSSVNSGMGGANVVDLPALQWLAKRPEKTKLWVSDGAVTGKGDQFLGEIYVRKIVKLVQNHKIIRIGNVRQLIKSGTLIDGKFDSSKEIVSRSHVRVVGPDGKTFKGVE